MAVFAACDYLELLALAIVFLWASVFLGGKVLRSKN